MLASLVRQGVSTRRCANVALKRTRHHQWSHRIGQWLGTSAATVAAAGVNFAFPVGGSGGGAWVKRGMPHHNSRGMSSPNRGMDFCSIHETSMVHASAKIGSFTTILEGVAIGEGCSIGSGCVIGPDVIMARDCTIGGNCTLSNATIGERVVLLPGVRIGQDGFGFLPANDADKPITKKPQTLRVVIGDDVEIGANSTVDRGSWRDTVIGAHSKLDNMVQVAHNVVLGRACLVASQSGIAGSTTVGSRVMIGGQVGIAQHLKIGDGAMIAGKSGVMTNLEGGGSYGGCPAVPARQWHKQTLLLRKLAQLKGGLAD